VILTIQNFHFLGDWFYKAELWDMTYYARIWSLRISRFEKVSSPFVTAAVKVLNKNEVLASEIKQHFEEISGLIPACPAVPVWINA
jgi:hypothetical protein